MRLALRIDLSKEFPDAKKRATPPDCGSTHYISLKVKDDFDGIRSNFDCLLGKYRLIEETGELKPIKKADREELMGKTIKIRSAAMCRHRSQYNICSTCYGELALSLPPFTNLGNFSVVSFCEIISQAVLSTKHLDIASSIEVMRLFLQSRRYFSYLASDRQSITLRSEWVGKKMFLIFPKKEIRNIEDLVAVEKIDDSIAVRMSAIRSVIVQKGEGSYEQLKIIAGKTPAYLSPEFLGFIKEKGWEITKDGSYRVEVTDLPPLNPILSLPKKNRSMVEYLASVAEFIESVGESNKEATHTTLTDFNYKEGSDEERFGQALDYFMDLVNSKVTVNVVHLEVFMLTYMVTSNRERNSLIPELGQPFEFSSRNNLFFNRSGGQKLAYEFQEWWLTSYKSFRKGGRPNHPLDRIILPKI